MDGVIVFLLVLFLAIMVVGVGITSGNLDQIRQQAD